MGDAGVTLSFCIRDRYADEERSALADGDANPSRTREYGLLWQPTERHVMVYRDSMLVAHVGLLRRTVAVGGMGVTVAGFGGVLTHARHRGLGLGHFAMREAEKYARTVLLADFGMLFCREALLPWYGAMNWTRLDGSVWVEQAAGEIRMPLPCMVNTFGAAPWPGGEVRLGCYPW
jgi:GNAT superfamily N-acetyltransferase